MSIFQIAVTALFIAFVIMGVGAFAILGGVFGQSQVGPVSIWGTMDREVFDAMLTELRTADDDLKEVAYTKKNPQTYAAELVNAMASGQSPDLFLITQEEIYGFSDKILIIPYGDVSQAEYLASFVDEGNLFLGAQGTFALPFAIDPLVMYWNRDLLAAAGVAEPPQYWNELIALAPRISSFDATQNIKRSAVSLGGWNNIRNAKAILSSLIMQTGDTIVTRGQDGKLQAVLGQTLEREGAAASALRFYSEFGNPSKQNYSWNKSLQSSERAFAAGQVAIYFGFAGEYKQITERNPNLRFYAARLPQIEGGTPMTYGSLTGIAISRGAQNPAGALAVAKSLTGPDAAAALAVKGLVPARRDVEIDTSGNAAAAAFAQSALIARGWVDPDPKATDSIFKRMVESTLSGGSTPTQAIFDAAQELNRLFGK
ncbi:hypothetical protein A2852_01255 [Candidatus Adlerbacteria bacterium RIFCSPHIGHO2_01_FULL_54_23]|uniref:ABC transporter substrate-binding protein n=3 Tax=Candidatus Adleribacteriota TaxID=1752736 RepID=A0A1F4XZZ7_9BACT|nr:MAG: hypothetical protein UY83_C0006G0078 [Candidatus Adlerbacteria bacterium GW2011_GWA1_54_10]KKW37740.1 MAG: hypothetical protein UY86_C0004G0069 [Candidatus Adlerbacteria bacterium GW2011_GWB1_54_7]OGC79280.1 MAG: hypothetical protein A2852_01255 [Candidatus Adlerbacteria bacterium RIFCSPHIGHO2_01_FULL_54_23]OGC87297.1 MAG: hypothetical protein A3B33_00805 [Candidatus Adlerbacteria bacterium RIFCSPLOWO2_01_FULL_54_16]